LSQPEAPSKTLTCSDLQSQVESLRCQNRRLEEQLGDLCLNTSRAEQLRDQRLADALRFRAVLANNNSGIMLLNPSGVIVDLVHPIFGNAPERMVGVRVIDILEPASAERCRRDMEYVTQTPGAQRRAEYLVQLGGIERWIDATMTDHLEDPSIHAVVVNYRDVTEEKLGQAKMALLAALVESSDWAIASQSFGGAILTWNPGAQRLYGYSANEVVGSNISILLPPGQPDDEAAAREVIRSGGTLHSRVTTRRRKDGMLVEVRVKIAPLANPLGELLGCSHMASPVHVEA
jgi:PAS domain S-box-containing protein